jgi:hypothetical protein
MQIRINPVVFSSGSAGTLTPVDIPCAGHSTCVAALGPGAECDGATNHCHTIIVDDTRSDWVLAGAQAIHAVDSTTPDRYRLGITSTDDPGAGLDMDAARYAGRLFLEVPADAAGVFTIDIETGMQTFWCDDFNDCGIPYTTLPGIISIEFGACCHPDGSCELVLPGTCQGSYQGDGTSCTPNPCPQPTCGDGIVNQPTEDCDGADDAACVNNTVCQADCTCACTCNGDVFAPFGAVSAIDLAHISDCAQGVQPPAQCQADDVNCDGTVTLCDLGAALRQFRGFQGGCEIPCGACCQPDGTCLHEQEYLCDGDPMFPQFAGVYQGDGASCSPNPCVPPAPGLALDDRCHGGPNHGQACANSSQCPSGICSRTDRCDGGPNAGQPCSSNGDCPSGWCGSKSIYASINPAAATLAFAQQRASMGPPLLAIRVELIDLPEYSNCNGQIRWVGAPQVYIEDVAGGSFVGSETQMTPFFHDWSAVPNLHIFGDAIVPNSTYEMRACVSEFGCSVDAQEVTTTLWADVVITFGPPANPNFIDIAAVVDKFKALPTRLPKTRTQLQPSPPNPDVPVNFLDIAAAVDAFKGKKYSDFFPGPSGCP